MNEEPTIKSVSSFRTNLAILLAGGIGLLSLSYYLISISLKAPYPQIPGIIVGGLLGSIGLWGLISIYQFDFIFIFSDHFRAKSILGNTKKVIYFNDITGWTEIEKKNKYSKWTVLIIYTEKTKYKINSSIYKNCYEIKRTLTKGKPRDIKKQNNWYRRNRLFYTIGFLTIGSVFLYASYHSFLKKDRQIQYSELHTVTDIITNKAEIKKGSKGSRSIVIKLKSYPYFNFEISANGYSATNKSDYVSNVKIGDTLHLDIMKDEYQMKLSGEKQPGFWDKTVNYHLIHIYELRDKNNTYLSLSGYNKELKEDASFGIWLFGIIGVIALVSGFLYLFSNHQE